MRRLDRLLVFSTFCAAGAAAAPRETFPPVGYDVEIERMAVDQDVMIDRIDLACTGIGDTPTDPKWAAYPIRADFSDATNEHMTDGLVALVDAKGEAVPMVRCGIPWLLLKPPPGTCAVYAEMMDRAVRMRNARFTVPTHGPKRVVLQFPDA